MRQSEYNTLNLIVIFHVALFHGSWALYLEIFHYLEKNKVKVKVKRKCIVIPAIRIETIFFYSKGVSEIG